MSRTKLSHHSPKLVRDTLNAAMAKAEEIHQKERELVDLLLTIDKNRFFVRYGFKSLRSFCIYCLNFGETQGQRIVAEVRKKKFGSPKKWGVSSLGISKYELLKTWDLED